MWELARGLSLLQTLNCKFSSGLEGSPGDSGGKESTCNEGDLGSIPGLRRWPGGGHGNLFQYSYLGNPHGQWSLAGCSSRGLKELDLTKQLCTLFGLPRWH